VTTVQSALPEPGPDSISELHIEFDGRQLTVRTDVQEMLEFIADAYSAMLVPAEIVSCGRFEFLRSANGYTARGVSEGQYTAPLHYLFEFVKAEVLLQFVTSRQDLMWMHAGGVELGGRALLFAGPSGNGKSTLATLLSERGWRFLSDDIAPIRMDADEVLPFPQTPRRRIHPGHHLAPAKMGELERETVTLDRALIQRAPTAIGGIVFPAFEDGRAAKLTRVAPGDAAFRLIRDCTNFADHKSAAVSRSVELARTIPVYGLSYSNGRDAANLLDSLR